MQAVAALRRLGYIVSANGEALVFKYAGPGQPDADAARPLLEILRTDKADALAYLRAEALADVPTSDLVAAIIERDPQPAEPRVRIIWPMDTKVPMVAGWYRELPDGRWEADYRAHELKAAFDTIGREFNDQVFDAEFARLARMRARAGALETGN